MVFEKGKGKGKDGNGTAMDRKQRAYKLRDQKANSVADIAEVLGRVWYRGRAEEVGLERWLGVGSGSGMGKERVLVRWSDVGDAEFARTWSPFVVHHSMGVTSRGREVPRLEVEEDGDDKQGFEEVEEAVERKEEGGSRLGRLYSRFRWKSPRNDVGTRKVASSPPGV